MDNGFRGFSPYLVGINTELYGRRVWRSKKDAQFMAARKQSRGIVSERKGTEEETLLSPTRHIRKGILFIPMAALKSVQFSKLYLITTPGNRVLCDFLLSIHCRRDEWMGNR